MESDNYPKNKEILKQRITILELEVTNDWGAVKMARDDLYGMILEKKDWLSKQCT